MNFLLIDDQKEVVRPLRVNLEAHFRREGIRLFHSSTIPDGLKEAKSDSGVVLVLLDLGMPCVGDPLEAVEYIKKFPQPVVCYTAHDDDILRQRASDLGAAGFICKDDSWDDQLTQIDEIVRQIKHARIRSRTEANSGLVLRTRPSKGFLATAGSLIVILGFVGGVIAGAYTVGEVRRGITDDITSTKKDTAAVASEVVQVKADLRTEAASVKAEVAKVKTDHDAEHKEDLKIMHRMDLGIKIIMDRLKITPPRDGE